jgi:hypothetical protein
MGIDDDHGFAETACGVLRKPEQDAAVSLPLGDRSGCPPGEGLLGLAQ